LKNAPDTLTVFKEKDRDFGSHGCNKDGICQC